MSDNDNDRLLPTAEVQRRYGHVSHMWVERKLKGDPTFPRPVYIGQRRYWRVADLAKWESSLPRTKAVAS